MGLFDGTSLERPVLCEQCGTDIKLCNCPPLSSPDTKPSQQTLQISLEKRKKGKLVTLVSGFSCRQPQIEANLVKLKNACGAGGSCDGGALEIQGNHVERVKKLLSDYGYRIK